jgi:hypothetical protein
MSVQRIARSQEFSQHASVATLNPPTQYMELTSSFGSYAHRAIEDPTNLPGGGEPHDATNQVDRLTEVAPNGATDQPSVGGQSSNTSTSHPNETSGPNIDQLAQTLYERIRLKLRRELLDDRERAGMTLDRMR